MANDFEIRPARPADAVALLTVRRAAILSLAEEYGLRAAERWANAPHSNLERAVESVSNHHVWVAEFDSIVSGWVELSATTIESLYVDPSAGRRGVGSALLTHAEHHVRRSGRTEVCLEASPNAEAFYARRGYEACGDRLANNALPMRKVLFVAA